MKTAFAILFWITVLPYLLVLVRLVYSRFFNERRYWNTLIALDHLVNAAFMNGDPAETVSSRAAKARNRGKRWGCILCKILDKLDPPDHCDRSIIPDRGDSPWPNPK